MIAGSTLLYTRHSLDTACERLSDLGFPAIDLATIEGWAHLDPSTLVDTVETAVRRVRTASDDLPIIAINAGLGTVEPEVAANRLDAVGQLGQELAVSTITLQPGKLDTLQADLERIERLATVLEPYDSTLCIEAHYNTPAEDPEIALEYAQLPGVQLTLDPSHFAVGPYWEDGYDALLDSVGHVHLRQAGDSWEALQRPVDDGRIDIERVLEKLRIAGYSGHYSIEYIDSLDGVDPATAERQAAQMFDRVRTLL